MKSNYTIETDNKEYWDQFYSKQRLAQPSTFFEFVKAQQFNAIQVVDIGCGNGRDTQAFAKADYQVIGLDRSAQAISTNTANALANESYQQTDISKVADLEAAFENVKSPALIYSRFFLHSIDEEAQHTLLSFLKNTLKKDDQLALEFRTKEDEIIDKVYDNHYRRYIDSEVLVQALEETYGFEVTYYFKGQGLSVFKDEDPYLARIIAKKK